MTIAARHADITTQDIICDNGMPAFLAYPAGGGPFPTVILMHERYGLVKHTRDQAMRSRTRRLSRCWRRTSSFSHPDQRILNAGDSRYDMTDPESVELIKAALAAMKKHEGRRPRSASQSAGYCQTGRHPLVFAAEVPISAAVVWYGAASKREWEVNKLQPKAARRHHRGAALPGVRSFWRDRSHHLARRRAAAFATASSGTRRATTFTSTRTPRTAGSTTPCRAATASRRPTPAGRRSSSSSPRCSAAAMTPPRSAGSLSARASPSYDFSKNVRLE